MKKTQRKKRKGSGATPGMTIKRCPYCGSPVVIRSADGIYKENSRQTMLYVCSNYPECDAYVRIQPGTKNIPLGSMANGELRALRREAHQYFDRIHQSGLMSKKDAYAWLSGVLAAPMAHAHIGQLSDYYCKLVIEESKRYLENNRTRLLRMQRNSPIALRAGGDPHGSGQRTAAAS